MSEGKEEQCAYCGHWYPTPVGYYHPEEECIANQKEKEDHASTQ